MKFSSSSIRDVKMAINSLALNTSLFPVSYSAAVIVYNMKDFTRVLYFKTSILLKVKYQHSFNTYNVRSVVNAI